MEHYERLYLISRHYVKEIKTISKGIPIFIGSVEQDPYTSAENVKKIEMNNIYINSDGNNSKIVGSIDSVIILKMRILY